MFDAIAEKLGVVCQWFKDLLAPVKATQDTLDSCKNVGVAFGQALADALMTPLNLFNRLSGKVDWLLEKLGVIKKNRPTSTRLQPKRIRLHRVAGISLQQRVMAGIRRISRSLRLQAGLISTRAKANTTSLCRAALRRVETLTASSATPSINLTVKSARVSDPT